MYQVALTSSYFPAQHDIDVENITIGQKLRQIVAANPTAPALVEIDVDGVRGRSWSYEELIRDAEELAIALASRFDPGERITVWAPNIPEWVILEYACAFAGIVLVTANPAYQPSELKYVLEQSGSVALFMIDNFRGNPMSEIAEKACAGNGDLREVVNLTDKAALYRAGSKDLAGWQAKSDLIGPDDAAQIQYTSGTTGFPKGAVLSHRGLINNARFYAARSETASNSVWMNMMPMFHTSGCGVITLGCLQAAGCMVLVCLFDPASVLRIIEKEKVTCFLGVPTMMVAVLEHLQEHKGDVSTIEMAVSGGSMVAPELVRRVKNAFGCEFQIVYGQTETSPVVTQHHAQDTLEDICHTVGQPYPNTEISIRSTETNDVTLVDVIGEICIRGYCNMIGYHANPQATAETIDSDGWLHTGDLGAMDARGYVRVTGRVKEMIIRGGENHFPAEIENVLLEHPAVAEVAVVGLPDDKWGEIIASFVRLEEGQEWSEAELRGHCREHMSPQKTPAVWVQVKEYPLTGSGKIRKFKLRDQYIAGDYS